MVVFTGQVAQAVIGTDAFQESDITGITIPITKHNYLIKDAAEHPRGHQGGVPHRHDRPARPGAHRHPRRREQARDRLRVARDGQPARLQAHHQGPQPPDQAGRRTSSPGRAGRCCTRAAACSSAGASKELKELAELMQLPVVATLMGKSAFPEDHHLSVGMPGMHGAKYTNYAITETDLLIAVGVRFDDRVTGKLSASRARPRSSTSTSTPPRSARTSSVDVPIVGDAKPSARRARRRAAQDRRRAARPRRGCARSTTGASSSRCTTTRPTRSSMPESRRAGHRPHDQGPQARHLPPRSARTRCGRASTRNLTEPRTWVSSGGLGTMGFGLPAAIGAQARHARPPGHRHRR